MPGRTDLVIFGASGDLARRKILPALRGLDDGELRVIGAGRSDIQEEAFRKVVAETSGSEALAATADWVQLDYAVPETYGRLKEELADDRSVIFYLATPPQTFSSILQGLTASGLSGKDGRDHRVVMEKPLGQDADSARRLNAQLAELFNEDQVYRIDHYLAKDTVQNVLAFRFSNSIFEPVWNRSAVQSIQITAAEEIGIEQRAGYYDRIGAVRDMVQNHVLQVLALVSMEPPATFDPVDIRRAKHELLRSVDPIRAEQAVRGQYEGYLQEHGVDDDSRRETYAAARLSIHNWRWDGVPIFIRTGKALRRQLTEVVIRWRDAPHLKVGGHLQRPIPTLLVMRFQPNEGITLRIGAKRPGPRFEMVPAGMTLEYKRLARAPLPDAYENVLSEIMAGGHTAFPGGKEIERSWEIVDPLIQSWESEGHPETYSKGSWGPQAAEDLVTSGGGGRWISSGDEPGT
ncbi:MAG: glucose-6-phosphate dehydrogenase [Chloroflexi bacterium]|nr:MAG: glucose-6-phosphate dehydrogenase [Chloroflexota bacterium]TME13943.1 MAG: glucose-6-phosphate dehydrogenase [Chloroflexota bacterium]